MRARVKNGRWVFDEPTNLPEGTEVAVVTRPVQSSGNIYLEEKLREYIHSLVVAASSLKNAGGIANPDDEVQLAEDAQARARAAGRSYTTPEDVKKAAPAVLRRLLFVREASGEGDAARAPAEDTIQAILDGTPVP